MGKLLYSDSEWIIFNLHYAVNTFDNSFLGKIFFFFTFFFWSHHSCLWDLSSLTCDRTHALCSGSERSKPLDCQGSPRKVSCEFPLDFCVWYSKKKLICNRALRWLHDIDAETSCTLTHSYTSIKILFSYIMIFTGLETISVLILKNITLKKISWRSDDICWLNLEA